MGMRRIPCTDHPGLGARSMGMRCIPCMGQGSWQKMWKGGALNRHFLRSGGGGIFPVQPPPPSSGTRVVQDEFDLA